MAELALMLGKRPYDSLRWRKIARQQLRDHPLCCMCLAEAQVVPATICDHVEPHKGNPEMFWLGKIQSLCIDHHNGTKQQSEKRGYHTDIGIDGWPKDLNHPVNKIEMK